VPGVRQFFSVTEVTKNRKPSIFTAPKHHGIREEVRQIHFVEVREAVYHKTSAKQPPQALRKFPGLPKFLLTVHGCFTLAMQHATKSTIMELELQIWE